MKNSLVLEQDYIKLIQDSKLSAKEQLKVIYALSDFSCNNSNTPKLKKKSLECYNKIIELMQAKAEERSQKYRENIAKRWNKAENIENTIVSQENTTVSNKNTIVSNADTTVSTDLYNCIQPPINKATSKNTIVSGKNTTVFPDDTTVSEDEQSPNIVNNINNIQSKKEIVNNNSSSFVSFVTKASLKNDIKNRACARVNIFNSKYVISIDERVSEKPEDLRLQIFQIFDIYQPQLECLSQRDKGIYYEVVDTVIEALLQANSTEGLKFNGEKYSFERLLDIILGVSSVEFYSIGENVFDSYRKEGAISKNRPYYILGAMLNASREWVCSLNSHLKGTITRAFSLTNETYTADSSTG